MWYNNNVNLLNEDQAIFVMTLSRNTQKVVERKVKILSR